MMMFVLITMFNNYVLGKENMVLIGILPSVQIRFLYLGRRLK